MARRASRKRSLAIEALMLEARRSGSLGTLHNRAAAELAGLNPTDWDCLDVLDWSGPITAGGLARRVGITSGAATGAIDRLAALGLVERSTDPADRRKVIVGLADQCRDGWLPRHGELIACFSALGAEIAEVTERFDVDALAAIAEWLAASNAALERSIDRMRQR